MPKIRINISVGKKRIEKVDDFIYKQNKKKDTEKTNRSEFLINSAEFYIANHNRKNKVGGE